MCQSGWVTYGGGGKRYTVGVSVRVGDIALIVHQDASVIAKLQVNCNLGGVSQTVSNY